MLFVIVTFLAGGNVEKLVCESFQDKSLFKVRNFNKILSFLARGAVESWIRV